MIKLGSFAFMHQRDNSTLLDPLSFVEFAHDLGLDAVEFDLNKAFPRHDDDYLFQLKQQCHRYGLQIGFVSGKGGGFVRSSLEEGGEAFPVVTYG